jgi:hypothetical protein
MKILITGACCVTARAIARSLKISPVFKNAKIYGTDICTNPYAIYEGLYDKIYRVPYVNNPEYYATLKTIVLENNFDGAIIVPELEVLYWSDKMFFCPVATPPPKFSQIAISKQKVNECLDGSKMVPWSIQASRNNLLEETTIPPFGFPCWVRDASEGTTSGKGALLAQSQPELKAWAVLNNNMNLFMISEFLPGRNFTCHLLYRRGDLLKIACYERLEYFMSRTSISGITGNICRGRLINHPSIVNTSIQGIESILRITNETMHGIVAVDMREDKNGVPKITEINLRHVAATQAFALAGFNIAEDHMLVTMEQQLKSKQIEAIWPENNAILRDIDGPLVFVPFFEIPGMGGGLHTH